MSFSHLEIIRIMCRSDLHGTSAELPIHILVSKDWYPAIHDWQDKCLTYKVLISLIIWMDSNTSITKHRFWTRGSNLDIPILVFDFIAKMPKMPMLCHMLDFYVRYSRIAVRAPVGNTRALIYKSLFI